jgi:hypothetical protein
MHLMCHILLLAGACFKGTDANLYRTETRSHAYGGQTAYKIPELRGIAVLFYSVAALLLVFHVGAVEHTRNFPHSGIFLFPSAVGIKFTERTSLECVCV